MFSVLFSDSIMYQQCREGEDLGLSANIMLSDKGLAQWEVAIRSDLGINNKNFSKELKADKCFPSDFLKK